MAIIKTLKESKIVSKGKPRQTIYPVTSSDAVIVPNKGKLTDALSKVAFSNDYNDLDNLPTTFDVEIPTNISAFNNDVGYLTSFTETDPTVPLWAKQNTKPSYNYSEILNTPILATVATSGNYNDLINKPTIPIVPTNVSAFNNDAGYLTQHQSLANYYTKPEVNSAIVNSNPVIEDTRSSAVSTITGVAPFASLKDGQLVIVRLAYRTEANTTLNLTLSSGTTTGAIAIYMDSARQSEVHLGVNFFRANDYMMIVYDNLRTRWRCISQIDTSVSYGTITQERINAGTDTESRLISPKLLRDNFYTKTEIDATIGNIETLLANI